MMRNLDKSISINGLTLKNRLVMPPMATSSANDGEVSQRILDYYDKKTKGGYKFICTPSQKGIKIANARIHCQFSINLQWT